jgi:RimJ/RimL family protein N-acetyltransferase
MANRLRGQALSPGDRNIGPVIDGDVIVETDRVVLRPWRVDEADRLFDMRRRMEVARWIGGRPMVDHAEAVGWIERMTALLAYDPRFGAWAVVERARGQDNGTEGESTGVPAGSVLLKSLPDGAGEIEIGWHLHPDSWGRGLASEAGAALLARGFALGLDEIWAVTHLDNKRSAAVCTRLGMRELGVTHRWYHEPSRMFWAGAEPGQRPTLAPDRPVPD